MYHGVRQTGDGPIYRVGLALLDLENPIEVIRRSDESVSVQARTTRSSAMSGEVVFPCGWTHDQRTDTLMLYYGGADSVIAVATASFSEVLRIVLASPDPRAEGGPITPHIRTWG